MDWWHAILLGIVEGITEFLPISSTGHLTIVQQVLGYAEGGDAGLGLKAFTAIIQMGAILAAIVYFRADIARIVTGWVRGLVDAQRRDADYRMGWNVIIGSLPVALVGLAFKGYIERFNSLWIVAAALVGWSVVLLVADLVDTGDRHEADITWRDTLIIGAMQCFALIPGVSRSGATISGGLFRRLDRVAATRLSFFLGIPALLAAGTLEAVTQYDNVSAGPGWGPTIVGTAVSFAAAYVTIAWLLRFVQRHRFTVFIVYRVALGGLLAALLLTGVVQSA